MCNKSPSISRLRWNTCHWRIPGTNPFAKAVSFYTSHETIMVASNATTTPENSMLSAYSFAIWQEILRHWHYYLKIYNITMASPIRPNSSATRMLVQKLFVIRRFPAQNVNNAEYVSMSMINDQQLVTIYSFFFQNQRTPSCRSAALSCLVLLCLFLQYLICQNF